MGASVNAYWPGITEEQLQAVGLPADPAAGTHDADLDARGEPGQPSGAGSLPVPHEHDIEPARSGVHHRRRVMPELAIADAELDLLPGQPRPAPPGDSDEADANQTEGELHDLHDGRRPSEPALGAGGQGRGERRHEVRVP